MININEENIDFAHEVQKLLQARGVDCCTLGMAWRQDSHTGVIAVRLAWPGIPCHDTKLHGRSCQNNRLVFCRHGSPLSTLTTEV